MRTNHVIPALILLFTLSGCGNAPSSESPTFDLRQSRWIAQESPSEASLRGLCAVSSSVAWASGSGGTVLRTIDGGISWQLRPIQLDGADDLDFRDVHAFDANRALVISAGLPARIYLTQDGGDSWFLTYANDNEGVFFDGMAFWDHLRGMAFSDPIDGKLLIITTVDGGRSWREIDRERIPEALDGEAGFAGSGTGIVVALGDRGEREVRIGLGGDTGADGARVFHSIDGGQTWKVELSPIHSSGASGIFSMAFGSSSSGVMVGGDYTLPDDVSSNVAYSADGGQTWKMPASTSTRPRGYRSVVCYLPREDAFVAGGPTGTDYSLDGGRTWRALGDEGFHVIACSVDGSAIWAVGAEGRISRLGRGYRVD